jgi:succinyldiaminopimelate transaminase
MTPMAAPATQAPAPYFTTLLDQAKQELARRGVEVFDFGVGDPLEPTPQFIRQALIDAVEPVSQYPTVVGQRRLREAVAGWARRRLDVTLDPDSQVLPAAGSKEAIFSLPLALLPPEEPRRRVMFPTPSYPVYAAGAALARGIPHPVPLREENGYRLDLRELPTEALRNTRIAWINYPHNPTGAGVDLAYLRAQVEVAREHGILLCADECYLDLYFDESAPPPSVLQVTQSGVLSFGSLSKRSGMTGYRSGYIAGDAETMGLLKRTRPNVGVASPNFIQAAATAAWSDDAHVAERRAIFRAKRDRLETFLEGKGYSVYPGEGGIYLWVRVPSTDSDAFFAHLLEHGIVVSPGASFGPGGEGYFRVALSPTLEQIERAIAVWDSISF